MKRDEVLALLAAEIVRRKEASRPIKVGIDGRCASGKTALANELAALIGKQGFEVLRPSVDGFHHRKERRYRQGEYSARGYYEDAYDYQAVVDHLLGPLSGNLFPVMCRQVAHDLRTDLLDSSPPVSVDANTVLLFDGLFLFRREINAYWDFRILVDIDAETSIERGIGRDTGVIGAEDAVRRKYELRYEPAWRIYVDAEHPESKADIILDNRELSHPRILSV